MKKFLIIFITILFVICPTVVFAGGNDSDSTGAPLRQQSCLYEGLNDDGSKFRVLFRTDKSYDRIDLLDDVRVERFGKNYNKSDFWSTNGFFQTMEVADDSSAYDGQTITTAFVQENGCFDYLYWKIQTGKDAWYFSNNSNQSISGGEVMRLNLLGNYQDTPDNVILNELVCTYDIPNDASYTMPNTIIYRLVKKDNGYSYRIIGDNGTGELKTWYEGEASASQNGWNSVIGGAMESVEVMDLLNPRVFWYSHSKAYGCPSMIMVAKDSEMSSPPGSYFVSFDATVAVGFPTDELDEYMESEVVNQLEELMSIIENSTHKSAFALAKEASFISYEAGADIQGNICNYGIESEMAENLDNWYYAVAEIVPFGEKSKYTATSNDTYPDLIIPTIYDIPSGKLMESCDDLPYLYTDCLNDNITNCKISATQFAGSTKLVQNAVLDEMDKTTIELAMSKFNGFKYKIMVCELGDRLNYLTKRDDKSLSAIDKLKFYDADGTNEKLYGIDQLITNQCDNGWGINTLFVCNDQICQSNLDYSTEQKIKEIKTYCNEMYSGLTQDKMKNSSYIGRVEECIGFDSFYSSLVSNGIIRDLSNGCNMLSDDFTDKLEWILDILKIAGPLLALGLGTLDFIKAVASGDSDKEMKNAFKRFSTRLIAAILLFVIPFILAFLMDIFIGNQNGYDMDNPFCGVEFKDD